MSTSTPSRESFSSNEYPDRHEGYTDDEEGEKDHDVISGSVRVRRGSEGWEIRPLKREEIVARYIATRGVQEAGQASPTSPSLDAIQQPGRYKRYVPEAQSSDGSDLDDTVPY